MATPQVAVPADSAEQLVRQIAKKPALTAGTRADRARKSDNTSSNSKQII